MNQAHIHLLITHLPITGSIIGALVLAYGLYTRSNHTKIAAYFVFILSAIGAGIAYLTGEAAEETVENIQGVATSVIEEHEEFALYALISLLLLGVVSLVGIFLTLQKSSYTRFYAGVALCISLAGFGVMARTGYLGGQIRHTEVSSYDVTQGGDTSGEETGEDED